jgi:hypothetical protein
VSASIKGDCLSTPVLFLIFNRPDLTRQVFAEIRRARPARLFVVADGPREDRPGEAELCRQAREAIQVDWDCDFRQDFRPKNLGAKWGVSAAIDWFFQNVEEGIILEDDCLPDPSFFGFCRELLAYYRHDTRIMHISGTNLQYGRKRGEGSYYFSRYMRCWGWATWRRAWAHFDLDLKTLPLFLEQRQLRNILASPGMRRYWRIIFQNVARGRVTTVWDFQWTYAIFSQNGLCVIPNVNLVSNLGWGPRATNTFDPKNTMAGIRTERLETVVHPTFVLPNREADEFEARHIFLLPIHERILNQIKRAGNILRRTR